MQRPRNPSSPISSGALQPIAIEVRPSPSARRAVIVFATGALGALLLSPQPSWVWRLIAAAVAIGLGWRPVRTVLFSRGPGAVRQVDWLSDGQWRVSEASGRSFAADLSAGSVRLGPWLLLAWKARDGHRCHALLDAACMDAAAFRALKGRLNC